MLSSHSYSKLKLALSPNNPSAWNYLRGLASSIPITFFRQTSDLFEQKKNSVLTRTATPFTTLLPFVLPLTAPLPETPLIADGVTISEDAELPAFLAIEFVADTALIEARGLFLHAAKGEKEKEELDEKTAEAAAVSLSCPFSVRFLSFSRTDVPSYFGSCLIRWCSTILFEQSIGITELRRA